MKNLALLCITSFIFLATARGQSKDAGIPDDFKKINAELEKLHAERYPDKYQVIHDKILRSGDLDSNIYSTSQSIFETMQHIGHIIERLKSSLNRLDSSGMRTDIAYKFLVQENNFNTLEKQLNRLYIKSLKILPQQDKAPLTGKETDHNSSWSEDYFKDIPTVAAITILNKIGYDAEQLAAYTLSAIYKNTLLQASK